MILPITLMVEKQEWVAPFYRWENRDSEIGEFKVCTEGSRPSTPRPQLWSSSRLLLWSGIRLRRACCCISSTNLQHDYGLVNGGLLLPLGWSQGPAVFAAGRCFPCLHPAMEKWQQTWDLRQVRQCRKAKNGVAHFLLTKESIWREVDLTRFKPFARFSRAFKTLLEL